MKREENRHFSRSLGKDMRLFVYGEGGWPVLVFPTQDAMCDNFENFGMIDTLTDFIEGREIQLFCIDTVDCESWSDHGGDKARRADRQEQYYHYVVDEMVPLIHDWNGSERAPLLTGCSMGATHGLIDFLRRPDLFSGVIALSGVYDAKSFFDGWMNPVLYDSSPVTFLANMPPDHPYIRLYNERVITVCVGQGAWEEEGIRTARILEEIFRAKGIMAWVDFWGYDVDHDWCWWKKQIRYFLPQTLARIKAREERRI